MAVPTSQMIAMLQNVMDLEIIASAKIQGFAFVPTCDFAA